MNQIYSALSTPSYPTTDGNNFFYISMTNSNRQTAVDNWTDPDTRTYNESCTVPLQREKHRLLTNVDSLFKDKTTFNEDISAWDTSNVTNMSRMFENAHLIKILAVGIHQVQLIWGICFMMQRLLIKTLIRGIRNIYKL